VDHLICHEFGEEWSWLAVDEEGQRPKPDQRTENDNLFTGKRYTAKKAWGEVLQKIGVEEELKTPPTGTGTDAGE
ncbi:hypothetical protein KUCAC02_002332, partial [Chaenocephalus aceratus]